MPSSVSTSICPLILRAHTQAHMYLPKGFFFNYVERLSTHEGRGLWRLVALDPLELHLLMFKCVKLRCLLTLKWGENSAVVLKNHLKTCSSTVNTECYVFSKKSIYLKLNLSATQEILPFHLKCMSSVSHSQHLLLNEAEEGEEEPTIFLKDKYIWEHGWPEMWETRKVPAQQPWTWILPTLFAKWHVFVQGKKPGCSFSMEGHLDSLQQIFRIRDLICCFSEIETLEWGWMTTDLRFWKETNLHFK